MYEKKEEKRRKGLMIKRVFKAISKSRFFVDRRGVVMKNFKRRIFF